MIYLSGCTNDEIEADLAALGFGLINQPGSYTPRRVEAFPYWAADNGCFEPATYVGHDRWLNWLDRHTRERCLFVVVPDVARRPDGQLGGDPAATWQRFTEYGPFVQEMGFPTALAAQDGIESMDNLAEQIEACDCLFIAGSTGWKVGLAAERLAARARNAGKWVHMGRCNSFEKIERARAMGCLSADGTFIKYAPNENIGRAHRWLAKLDAQPMFPLFDAFEAPTHPTHRGAHNARALAAVGASHKDGDG